MTFSTYYSFDETSKVPRPLPSPKSYGKHVPKSLLRFLVLCLFFFFETCCWLSISFLWCCLEWKCFVFISNEHEILALRFLMISRVRSKSTFVSSEKRRNFLKWNFVCKQHLEMKWRWCVMNRMHDVGVNHTLDSTLSLRSTYDFNLTFKQSCIFDCLFSYQFIRFDKVFLLMFCFVCGCLFWHVKLCKDLFVRFGEKSQHLNASDGNWIITGANSLKLSMCVYYLSAWAELVNAHFVQSFFDQRTCALWGMKKGWKFFHKSFTQLIWNVREMLMWVGIWTTIYA